jgi:hypothetical protein
MVGGGACEEDAMINQPPPSPSDDLDFRKWAHEQNMKAAERAHDKSDEFVRQINEAAINVGNLALRMGMLINGGAAVALLTFVGNLPAEQKRAVAATLGWFAGGVAAAVLGLALAYFTNYCIVRKERSKTWNYQPPYVADGPDTNWWHRLNVLCHILAIVVGLGSLVLFVVGMFYVRAALTKL